MNFNTYDELFNLTSTDVFYVSANGTHGHHASNYGTKPIQFSRLEDSQFSGESSLGFDIANGYIQATIDIEGTVQDVRSAIGLTPFTGDMRGVFAEKTVIGGGPWKMIPVVSDHGGRLLATGFCTTLLNNLFPLTTYTVGPLACRSFTFAPQYALMKDALPVVVSILELTNDSNAPVHGDVSLPSEFVTAVNSHLVFNESGQAGMFLFDPLSAAQKPIPFALESGQRMVLAVAYIVGTSGAEIERTAALLQERSALKWAESTLAFHQARLGLLSIEDSYYAQGLIRLEELSRQANLLLPDGSYAGGTLGSNVNPNPNGWWNKWVWMKDNYYSALAMSVFQPELCKKSIAFFMRWGIPEKTRGRGTVRFPNAEPLTQSVSNALSGIALAVSYYRMTGDRAYFLETPEFLISARDRLERLLDTRANPNVYLFPSLYVSDGDARGDFHTGTNLVAWYAFKGMSRLCREVYLDEPLADRYNTVAKQIRSDLEAYCKGQGILGEQYFEGAFADGSFVPVHDGEETDVALMPFYGYCEPDSLALIRHSRLALTPNNFHYSPKADGVAWFDEGYGCQSTFPGFITALAGAENEAELLHALERIRSLTDLDGSIWWWPHKLECESPDQIVRWPSKCCWASSIYVLKFVHDILGLQLDYPARQISFRPFTPWKQFAWEQCQIGAATFDFTYTEEKGKLMASVTNRNAYPFKATIELVLPTGATSTSFQIGSEKYSHDLVRFRMRYNQKSYSAVMDLAPGESLNFAVHFQP